MTNRTTPPHPRTIGMDLGARKSSYCTLDSTGKLIKQGTLVSSMPELAEFFGSQPKSRLVIEASGPCRWVSELAESLGHEVVVANPREFRLICDSHRKCDRNDARILADFGQIRPRLLHPVKLRGLQSQLVRTALMARAHLVHQRTLAINFIRAQVRNLGQEVPSCSAAAFHKVVQGALPEVLRPILEPMLEVLTLTSEQIKVYDVQLERMANEVFPETARLRQIDGVGVQTALAFVATIEDPSRFADSRDIGPYTGLVSMMKSSGSRDPQLRISKRGDKLLRRLLVNAASYILRANSMDCDLKRFGVRLQGRGGQAANAKARIAVARKLAVLLHRLWVTGQDYDPNRCSDQTAA